MSLPSTILFLLCILISFVFSINARIPITLHIPYIQQVTYRKEAHRNFSMFKERFGKSYATQQEHNHRFSVYEENLLTSTDNLNDPSAHHGVTKFSDLTREEFYSKFLGLNRPIRLSENTIKAPILPTNDLPKNFDWRDHGAVTSVKNQGSCGSCWSFSTIGALEGSNYLATGKLVSLSDQQLVDCDHQCDPEDPQSCDSGCDGGCMDTALKYSILVGGVMREEDYPYTGTDNGVCKFDESKVAAKVANFSVVSLDEDQIKANLVKNGPLIVTANVEYMRTYNGGVSCPFYTTNNLLSHSALLVGYGETEDMPGPRVKKNRTYWIIKNSWGSDWGEDGYYRLCHAKDETLFTEYMVTAVIAVSS